MLTFPPFEIKLTGLFPCLAFVLDGNQVAQFALHTFISDENPCKEKGGVAAQSSCAW